MSGTRYADLTGAFEIETYPGQPQMAHCHAFFVRPALRGNGYGHYLKSTQNALLQNLQIDYATCTVLAENNAQISVLKKAGWRRLDVFFDRRQNALVELWGYRVIAPDHEEKELSY